jgi:hypothetical protein
MSAHPEEICSYGLRFGDSHRSGAHGPWITTSGEHSTAAQSAWNVVAGFEILEIRRGEKRRRGEAPLPSTS